MSEIAAVAEAPLARIPQSGKLEGADTLERLFTVFYDELHRRAKWELRHGTPVTLEPTTLLHETFLNMSHRDALCFTDHREFLFYAARAMRGLIIDHFRNRSAQKRGGLVEISTLPTELPHGAEDAQAIEIESLRDALESLGTIDPRLAECVDLKFFCGLSFVDIARLRDVSERTVQRDWDKARLLLRRLMHRTEEPGTS